MSRYDEDLRLFLLGSATSLLCLLAVALLITLLSGCHDWRALSSGLHAPSADGGAADLSKADDPADDAGGNADGPSTTLDATPRDLAPYWPDDLALPADFPPNFDFAAGSGAPGASCSTHADCETQYCHLGSCALHPTGTPSGPNGALSCATGYQAQHLYSCSAGTCSVLVCADPPTDGGAG